MSKTVNSNQASAQQAIPSRLPTWTTSDGDALEMAGRSIEIMEGNRLRYSVLVSAAIFVSVLISYGVTKVMILRPEGMVSLGYSAQTIQVGHKTAQAFIPIYATKETFKQLQETNP